MEFSEYVAARGPALERFAYVLSGDAHLAEDLVQVALLKAYRRWRWVARADHPDAYVRRIVTTSYLDWRRRRSSGEAPVASVPDRAGADVADGVADRDQLHRALATLTPRQRAVLVLRHYEGLDDAAIAALLRCGETSVRSHASRGLQRLRACLDQTTNQTTNRTTNRSTDQRMNRSTDQRMNQSTDQSTDQTTLPGGSR